jgi:GAF domain-containing protein
MARDIAEDFAEMALRLKDEDTLADAVERVLEYAVKELGCGYAGVMFLHRRHRVETAAATDPLVERLDRIQVEVGEGPDMEVVQDRYSVLVPDLCLEPRWPTWSRQVVESGIRSFLNVRLYTYADTIGTLNFYDSEPNRFEVADQEVAHLLARHAAVALASAREVQHLWQAVDARKLIGQAQGILMERYQITGDQAFSVLLRYSQDRNVKLREVAGQLIESRELPR